MLFHWGLEIIERFERVLNETFYDDMKRSEQLWGVLCQASAAVLYGRTNVQPDETNYW